MIWHQPNRVTVMDEESKDIENKDIQKSEFYAKLCAAVVEKITNEGYPQHLMLQGESTIELLIRHVKNTFCSLSSICFICLKPLGHQFAKLRTCGQEMCEFRFEENNLGNIFNEIKKDPAIAHFLVETAFMAFNSGRAGALTEPFPSFLLKNNE